MKDLNNHLNIFNNRNFSPQNSLPKKAKQNKSSKIFQRFTFEQKHLSTPRKASLSAKFETGVPSIDDFTQNSAINVDQIHHINKKNYRISQLLSNGPEQSSSDPEAGSSLSIEKVIRPSPKLLSDASNSIPGKIFFSDCSNGTSCLFVGHFKDPECVSTENAFIIGIGGFHQEFSNKGPKSNESNHRQNLDKIVQFSYSPRVSGAFVSEEKFSRGSKKTSKTLFHNGIRLQLFYSPEFAPVDLVRFLPSKNELNNSVRNKSSQEKPKSLKKSEVLGLVTFPFEKYLISLFGYINGNIKSFSLSGVALFNRSLPVSQVKMGFQVFKSRLQFKLPRMEKIIRSLDSFFDHVQLSQMKFFLEKPDPQKINGYHVYKIAKERTFQGFFFNDFLIIHKDAMQNCISDSSPPKLTKESPIGSPFECLNCAKKPLSSLMAMDENFGDFISNCKANLCSNCKEKFFGGLEKKENNKKNNKLYKSYQLTSEKTKKEIKTPYKINGKIEAGDKIDFPFEGTFRIDSHGFSLTDFLKETEKKGPTKSPNYFKGEILNEKKQGFVYENFENNECYAGDYIDGFREGTGKLYKYQNYFYQGQFRKGRKWGKGVISFPNGEHFKCEFRNNVLTHFTKQPKGSIPVLTTAKKNNKSRKSISPSAKTREKKSLKQKRWSNFIKYEKPQMRSKSQNKKKKLRRFTFFEQESPKSARVNNLTEWINRKQEIMYQKESLKSTPKWTPEQKELFDDKSDAELTDLKASTMSRSRSRGMSPKMWKSPKKLKETVFLFANVDSLNFKKNLKAFGQRKID